MSSTGDARHTVKLDDDQWEALVQMAEVERRSLTNLVGVLLDEALEARSEAGRP